MESAGVFMAGFYFIFMFGVPAIALAMYSAAKPENKSKVAGMMFSIAFTAFLTGITEPVEFTFMFLAPVLYAFHAVMTGIALAVANMFGILHGFGFSAGLIDYVLNYGLATKPILIIPIGLVFGIIYFIVFRWAIVHFDLPTPGRFENESDNEAIENANPDELAQSFIDKLGGADNLTTISSCITRLRLNVKDIDKIDEAGLKALGAAGVIKNALKERFEALKESVSDVSEDRFLQEVSVLLSCGQNGSNAAEDEFLARNLGISAVEPVDLSVRKNYVFLKTSQELYSL